MVTHLGPIHGASRLRGVSCAVFLAACALAVPSFAPARATADRPERKPSDSEATELHATGMTFVGNRREHGELVVHSRLATFYPDRDLAHLEEVRAVVTDDDAGDSFEMTCDRADLNVETNDFRAEGNVRGSTADGQHYSAPWVEYDHEGGLLRSDAPVVVVDDTGSFRGNGFRYHVKERRFQLLGNVHVEQNP